MSGKLPHSQSRPDQAFRLGRRVPGGAHGADDLERALTAGAELGYEP
jgi:hypothetical protein